MASLQSQTLVDWELIVCDSYSNDGSWEFFRKFERDRRVRLFQVPRKGSYAGWNECLQRATGEYIYIATSDDTCTPDLLEKMVGALERSQEPGVRSQESERERGAQSSDTPTLRYSNTPPLLAVCDFDFIDEHSHVIDPPPRGAAKTFYGEWLKKHHRRSGELELLVHLCVDVSWTTITAVVFKRTLLEKVGLFRADCGPLGDRFWATRSALHSDTVFVPGRLATWRWHTAQESAHHTWRESLVDLDVTTGIVEECSELVPARWKDDPQWRAKLLWGPRTRYLQSFDLDRGALRTRPGRFLGGAARAAMREPAFLVRRLLAGLRWDSTERVEDHEYLMDLVHQWNVPWPPEPL